MSRLLTGRELVRVRVCLAFFRWIRSFGCLFERLEGQVVGAKALDVLQLLIELVEVALLVVDQSFEDLLGGGIGVLGACESAFWEQLHAVLRRMETDTFAFLSSRSDRPVI